MGQGEEWEEGGGKRMRPFRLVSLLISVGGWVSGSWLEELKLKPTIQLRVGQNVFLRASDYPYLCGHMYLRDKIRLHQKSGS